MNCFSGLVGLLLVLTAEAAIGNSSQHPFCRASNCLQFDVHCKFSNFEVRHYKSAKWVLTTYRAKALETMIGPAYWRLNRYLAGENEAGKKLSRATPILIGMPKKKFYKKIVFTMSFLLPKAYQTEPLKPTNPHVNITETPDMYVYVAKYNNYMNSWNDILFTKSLSNALKIADAKYRRKFHYSVVYGSGPITKTKKYTEVWVISEGEPKCDSPPQGNPSVTEPNFG